LAPEGKPIQVKIYDGGRVQGEPLRDEEPADDRDAERPPQFRPGAGFERQRQASDQGADGRHQDRQGGGNAVEEFLSKHAEDVIGTLSGFDRLVFRGTLRVLAQLPRDRERVARIPTSVLLLALAATAVSYAPLFGYNLSGLHYARARPPLGSVVLRLRDRQRGRVRRLFRRRRPLSRLSRGRPVAGPDRASSCSTRRHSASVSPRSPGSASYCARTRGQPHARHVARAASCSGNGITEPCGGVSAVLRRVAPTADDRPDCDRPARPALVLVQTTVANATNCPPPYGHIPSGHWLGTCSCYWSVIQSGRRQLCRSIWQNQ
jgi:hypothetical protein